MCCFALLELKIFIDPDFFEFYMLICWEHIIHHNTEYSGAIFYFLNFSATDS